MTSLFIVPELGHNCQSMATQPYKIIQIKDILGISSRTTCAYFYYLIRWESKAESVGGRLYKSIANLNRMPAEKKGIHETNEIHLW